MANGTTDASAEDVLEIDLHNPVVAAVWAWLIPGAGHIYQRRYAKGALFMICILSTYFFGLALGDGKVVYASFTKEDRRWQYVCQLGVGAPALPAAVQSFRVQRGDPPLFEGFMAPPTGVQNPREAAEEYLGDELAQWHLNLHSYFELGTLYTMIAGLLNVLVIYDAYSGPLIIAQDDREKSDKPPPEDAEGGGDS